MRIDSWLNDLEGAELVYSDEANDLFLIKLRNELLLSFGTPYAQGRMSLTDSNELPARYMFDMICPLLFIESKANSHVKCLQLGLGAGALTRYCANVLNWHCDVVELKPLIVDLCYKHFHLNSVDKNKLQVHVDDAAHFIAHCDSHVYDVIQIDLFNENVDSPVFTNVEFYINCLRLLNDNGAMSINLLGNDAIINSLIDSMHETIDGYKIVKLDAKNERNIVLLLYKNQNFDHRNLFMAAKALKDNFQINAQSWLSKIFIS